MVVVVDLAGCEREVAELRRAAATDPEQFQPKLVSSLSRMAYQLREAGRPDEALAAAEEAMAVGRSSLVAGHADVEHRLSTAVRNLVRAAGAVAQPARARIAIQQTSDVLRQLVAADAERYEAMLAEQLRRYSGELRKLDPAAAVPMAEESAAIARRRFEEFALRDSLRNLQLCLAAAGRKDEAEAAHREQYARLAPNSLLEEADFTIRTYNTLKRLGCHRLRDLARLSLRDLLLLPSDTRWAAREVTETLAFAGLAPLAPGRTMEGATGEEDDSYPPDYTFGVLCVRCDAEDAVAQIREAVIAAYAAHGAHPVDAATHLALFAEGEHGLDRDLEVNPGEELGSDLVVIIRECGAWVGVYSARWELAPQGRHPLALRLSQRWPVLSLTATADVAYELCRYQDGAPVQYAAQGRPAGPPPAGTPLDFDQLAAGSWIPTTASELRANFGHPPIFGNLTGLPSSGLKALLEGWPLYDPGEAGDSVLYLWRG